MGRTSVLAWLCAVVPVVFCGCSNKTTTPTETPASPTITENWIAVLPVGGTAFYAFSVSQKGTVNMTLVSVTGGDVPSDVALALGIGTPSGAVCSTSNTTTAGAGTSPQVTGTYDPGVYCAKVSDPGNLPAAATIAVSVAHP